MKKKMLVAAGLWAAVAWGGAIGDKTAAKGEVKAKVTVDWTQTCGPVKPVNGVGQPPMIGGPKNFTMFKYLKDAGIPYSRLHDVDGKFGANLYVDVPNLFRDFDADENDPKNYDFAFTDALLRQLAENGVEPWFRLGVTIENYPEFNRYRIFPPKDYAKWARICEHIVRHYTEGWANGMRLKITYWEIWNEADLNPDKESSMTWAGTFDEYCAFYAVAARHLKAKFPHLKIGGPASCGLYVAENPMARGQIRYHVDCCIKFLDYVKKHDVPMDFFSFHSYSPVKPALQQIASARRFLVERGLGNRETWLNEWLCHVKHENLGTAFQASGVAAELIGMQNSELSGACIYDAKCGVGNYSPLFNPMTYKPHKAYYAFTAFNELRRRRTAVKTAVEGASDLWACAAADGRSGAVMLANASPNEVALDYAFGTAKVVSCRLTDDTRTDAVVALPHVLPPYSFVVVLFDFQFHPSVETALQQAQAKF